MSKDDGGPAFARADLNGDYQNWEGSAGMSLRDYFAAKAMQGMLCERTMLPWNVSTRAYEIADCMLEVRAK